MTAGRQVSKPNAVLYFLQVRAVGGSGHVRVVCEPLLFFKLELRRIACRCSKTRRAASAFRDERVLRRVSCPDLRALALLSFLTLVCLQLSLGFCRRRTVRRIRDCHHLRHGPALAARLHRSQLIRADVRALRSRIAAVNPPRPGQSSLTAYMRECAG